jgi:hypothetical protein
VNLPPPHFLSPKSKYPGLTRDLGSLRLTDLHGFSKPNDERGLKLMDEAAKSVMNEYKDIVLGFGESDEFR